MKKEKFTIKLPGLKKQYVTDDRNCVVRISKEAYNTVVDLYNQSPLSMAEIVSTIIVQAKNHIELIKED